MLDLAPLAASLNVTLPEHTFRNYRQVTVPAAQAHNLLAKLKTEHGFDMLLDITAVDYLEWPDAADRFGVIYQVVNTVTGERLAVKAYVNPPRAELPTVYDLWKGCDWMEREVYDMFGITFAGHPDLRRILMPDEFTSYPLRKDYPVQGMGERHNFPVITRAES